ncbi:rod shape-determining protein MreC [Brevundimonas sp. PAMC22021]|uniref:rod shape-determining protein MreC n=1 Tax=Brevundimonas sp. PAMC22021 TaxID=2861285 RepID=UPI001C630ECC|nr:rod shape-determining protein MreC [Brevundimonas sp. PAMC22021]QYF87802.1 rod shape-determining protein MreC [Brevundimonas sp. PAMC22021]
MAFRDGPFDTIKVPLVWTAAVVVVVGLIVAVLLLISDTNEPQTSTSYGVARGGFEAAAAPAGSALSAPVRWVGGAFDYVGSYFFALGENRRLRREVADLRAWRDDAIALKNVNRRYETMLGVRVEPEVPMATARTISDARGPFKNARLLDIGSNKGVQVGNPVVNEHGLVGRISGVTGGVSRMVLLTDVASRTPVLIDRTDARAILTGDGSGNPRLAFVRGADAVKAGDRILSSGDGGGIPRGVPIGVAAKGLDGSWRVKLFSDRGAVDYVRVLLFRDFAQLVNPAALNAPTLSGLRSAAPPTPEQAAIIADAVGRLQALAQADAERARAALAAQAQAQAQAPTQTPPNPAAPGQPSPLPTGSSAATTRPAPAAVAPARSTPSPTPTAQAPAAQPAAAPTAPAPADTTPAPGGAL